VSLLVFLSFRIFRVAQTRYNTLYYPFERVLDRAFSLSAWATTHRETKQTWHNNNCSGMVAIKARDLSPRAS